MSSILFLALQCFECSTMQVKQKKKSSNNWVCVVCNQKQSVRKVFAQGYKAKDLRFFVQSFNMSRKAADEEKQIVSDTFPEVEDDAEVEEIRGKKRSDWSEYLDSDPPNQRRKLTVEEHSEEDVKIVTEIPKEMFKRPKLNRHPNEGGSSSAKGGVKRNDKEPFKPTFSRSCIEKQDGVMNKKTDSGREAVGEWDKPVMDVSSEYQIVDDEVHPDFM